VDVPLLPVSSLTGLRLRLTGPVVPHVVILGQTQEETSLLTFLSLHDFINDADRIENTVSSGTPIGYVGLGDVLTSCITVHCAII
jgi:hypothetical protein